MNAAETKATLTAERDQIAQRMTEIDEALSAFAVLEGLGIRFGSNGTARESPVRAEIRSIVLKQNRGETFGLAKVVGSAKKTSSRMTIRSVVKDMVVEGLLEIVREGSRGRATEYRLLRDTKKNQQNNQGQQAGITAL